jgi:hypothetical protein
VRWLGYKNEVLEGNSGGEIVYFYEFQANVTRKFQKSALNLQLH